jgi:hypothetical protein
MNSFHSGQNKNVRFEVPTAVSIEVIWFSRMRHCVDWEMGTSVLEDFSALKMEATYSFEILITLTKIHSSTSLKTYIIKSYCF